MATIRLAGVLVPCPPIPRIAHHRRHGGLLPLHVDTPFDRFRFLCSCGRRISVSALELCALRYAERRSPADFEGIDRCVGHQKVWAWFRETLLNRLEPGASVLIITTPAIGPWLAPSSRRDALS